MNTTLFVSVVVHKSLEQGMNKIDRLIVLSGYLQNIAEFRIMAVMKEGGRIHKSLDTVST
jgi:hypothetical protein